MCVGSMIQINHPATLIVYCLYTENIESAYSVLYHLNPVFNVTVIGEIHHRSKHLNKVLMTPTLPSAHDVGINTVSGVQVA
jgi:hypothetical protein